MACNCGNRKSNPNVTAPSSNKSSGSYALTMPDGKRYFYDTETAARSANNKAGGKGLVRRVS